MSIRNTLYPYPTTSLLIVGSFFLYVTTSKKKLGFLLIAVFRKLINPQIEGHQGTILGGRFYLSGFLVNTSKHANSYHQNNARGLLVNISSLSLNVYLPQIHS